MENFLHEECGVFGIYTKKLSIDAAKSCFFALYALQHRGQESCGIAVNRGGIIKSYKNKGLVSEVFNAEQIEKLGVSKMAIGQVRYSTTGNSNIQNAQPLCIKHIKGPLAITHNGNITNAAELRQKFENLGAIFHGSSDTEVIAYAITQNRLKTNSIEEAVKKTVKILKGSFSLVLMSAQKLIAVRDPIGFRPLCMGKTKSDEIMFSSESCAFSSIGGSLIREIKPGEIVVIKDGQISHDESLCKNKTNLCIFEYVYFARPDSVIENMSVYKSRLNAGKLLAKEHPAKADVVVGVPDSGVIAAKGFAMESKLENCDGFIKNKYIGRSFIEPTQSMRENVVKIKLNAIETNVKGKRVVMVDDSIVRGTTCKRIVKILRNAKAKEVHVRIACPPFTNPCYFGTDIDSKKNLIACKMNLEEMRKYIDADSLGFLSLKSLKKTIEVDSIHFCSGCFTGKYPQPPPKISQKDKFDEKIKRWKFKMKNDNEYKKSGVDVTAGYESVNLIKPLIKTTQNCCVLGSIGGFAGLYEPNLKNFKNPVFVSGTDGVGTKIKIATKLEKHRTIGIDCVAMCVNDIICTGAKPLFFLDYIACGKNKPEKIKDIVYGIVKGCKESEMALIGGETAEHPKVMKEQDYDIAGFAVGVVEKDKILPKKNLELNDSLIAIASSGVHSNGFSLIREIFDVDNVDFKSHFNILEKSLGEVLLEPTKIYVNPILNLLKHVDVKAICHITGGGFFENIPRILTDNFDAVIYRKNLKIHTIFKLIMKQANISEKNMFEIFNMGVGMICVVPKQLEEKTINILKNSNVLAYKIGHIENGEKKVRIV